MSELKPCPFCGEPADDRYNRLAKCSNKSCLMNHWVDDEDFFIDDDWNTRPIEDALRARIAELEAAQRWIPVSERLPEVYRNEDGEFIPFLVCEGDGDRPFIAMYGGTNWHAGIFVPDVTHWMPLPELPEVQE